MYQNREEIHTHVYFINSGLVSFGIPGHAEVKKYGMGEIVGLENVFSKFDTNIATAKIDSTCHVYELPIGVFRDLSHSHLDLEIACKKENTFYAIKNF